MYQRQVCFVCGGGGAELSLYSKPREKGPYFPFLDTHSPPRGARQPQADGLIDSCQVCYQFLNQQWESFEITKTPPIKRLYWLKRVDNGTFTGAEMRIQGEYAAQIMGLQYHPTSTGTLSPYEYSYPGKDGSEVESVAVKKSFTPEESTVPSKKAVSVVASPSKSSLPKSSATKIAPGDGDAALDLSVTTSGKQANTKSMDEKKINLDKVKTEKLPSRQESQVIVCYVCGQECPLSLGRFISAQKNSNDEPFFPFLEKMSPPSGCMPLTKHGLTKACSECRKTLSRQWRYYESNNFLEDQRMYHINDIPVFNLRREIDKLTMEERRNLNCLATESEQMTEVCYLCVQKFQRSYMRWIHTTKAPNDTDTFSMYFPIIRKLACPEGAIPMDMEGRVLGCRACYSYLQGQWQAYQGEDVPMEKRQFLMRPIRPPYDGEEKKKDAEFGSKMSLDQKGIIVTDKEGSQHLLNINTSPSQSAVNRTGVPESPLISPYNQASGLLAIASGSFPFSSAAIPNSTMFQGSRLAQQLINQPLQIKKEPEESNISSSIDANIMKKQKSSGNENLADADMGKKNKSSVNENQPDRSDANKVKKQKSSVNENQTDADIGKKQKSCENENQVSNYDVNKKSEAQFIASENSYCFLCGYDCREEIWHLQAQPGIMSPADVSSKKPPPPFFPFLVHRRQAVRARPISSDGHVKVCGVCYVNMTEQFYESQQTGIMPWEAKYTTESVRCILCLKMTQRINAVTMKLPKAELQELRKETSAQIFSNDEESKQPLMVLVCRICVEQQVKASTAVPSRKSLDISHDSDIDVEGVEDEPTKSQRKSSKIGAVDDLQSGQKITGLSQGSKPPPLTMVNSIPRTTATVPPLSQQPAQSPGGNSSVQHSTGGTTTSSSAGAAAGGGAAQAAALSATRASSFAAALRNLAKQAGDTGDADSSTSEASPSVSASSSPRDNTPKRAGVPAHTVPSYHHGGGAHVSSINSPPVVTIAPTPAHTNSSTTSSSINLMAMSDRKNTNSDRGLNVDVKAERDKMTPVNNDRREDERPLSKESSSSGAHRISAHSLMGVAAPTTSSGQGELPRGFQPYRPGDELRSAFPHHPYASLDPASAAAAAAAYSYQHAALAAAPHAFSHSPYRLDDQLLLERYRMMQPGLFGAYAPPGMMGHHGVHPLLQAAAGAGRYPAELLSQQHLPSYMAAAAGAKLPEHISPGLDRSKSEQELRQEREKEAEREKERLAEKEKEMERQREKEKEEREKAERERREREREKERQRSAQRERERHRHLDHSRSPISIKREDPTGMKSREGSSSIFSAERLIGSRPANYSTSNSKEPLDLHKPSSTSSSSSQRDHMSHSQAHSQHSSIYSQHESERQRMHQRFLMEQEAVMREKEKSERRPPSHQSLSSHHNRSHSPLALTTSRANNASHIPRTTSSSEHPFHRPFEGSAGMSLLSNGYERESYLELEHRLMVEKLGEDKKGSDHGVQSHSQLLDYRAGSHPSAHSTPRREASSERNSLSEGMQARLLDSEKMHNNVIKMEHGGLGMPSSSSFRSTLGYSNFLKAHAHHSQQSQQAGLSSDRLNKDLPPHLQQHNLLPNDPVITSKLDLDEKHLRDVRLNELDYERSMKRRKLYQETNVSPPDLESSRHDDILHGRGMPSTRYHPDDLNHEPNYKYKARFLFKLGLEPVPPERRKQMDIIRQVCEWDKQRRQQKVLQKAALTHDNNHLTSSQSLLGIATSLKRKHGDVDSSSFGSSLMSSYAGADLNFTQQQHLTLAQLQMLRAQKGSAESTPSANNLLLEVDRSVIPSETQMSAGGGDKQRVLSREFAQEFHQSVLQTTRLQQDTVKHGVGHSVEPPRDTERARNLSNTGTPQQSTSERTLTTNVTSQQRLAPKFQQADPHKDPVAAGSSGIAPTRPFTGLKVPIIESRFLSSRPSSITQSSQSPVDGSASCEGWTRWPGIEAAMEAYHRHAEEQREEYSVLKEQCRQLQSHNAELNRTAEHLSRHMGERMQNKQRMEEERLHQQKSIDNLKKCLKFLR